MMRRRVRFSLGLCLFVYFPWVISGDTGIHPSTVGYAQMASQVPAPG